MLGSLTSKKIINPSTFASLSNFQAIMLQLLLLIVTVGYGSYHLFFDNLILGLTAALSSLCSSACIFSIYKRKLNGYYFLAFFASQFLCLVFTSYFYGLRGLILVFPVSACAFYVFSYRLAFYASLALIVVSLLAAYNVESVVMLFRISVALLLSISFLAAFSFMVSKQYRSLDYDATHDYLTKLMNRRGFSKWVKQALRRAKSSGVNLTLFYMDLDGFKSINDNYGQNYGDEVLIAFPGRVISTLRSGCNGREDSIHFARISGDEFTLAIEGLESQKAAQLVALRIIESVNEPFSILNTELRISISIGIASADVAGFGYSTLINHASAAMHEEKLLGKNGFCYFDESVANKQLEQDKIEQLVRTALDEDGFKMMYQPIYACRSRVLKGAEALVRCPKASELGIYPDTFIPVAEKVGLIRRLDLWVIESVLKSICSLPEGHDYRKLFYSINISALELHNTLFPSKLRQILSCYPVNPRQIQLEITETSLIALDERCMNVLRELNSIGVKLALDDFGMGYTAFNQLRSYPVHTLKIDRSFITDLDVDREQASEMVELILSLAHLYRLKVTAEGVETMDQLAFLQTTRCDLIQGYVLSRPVSWKVFQGLPNVGQLPCSISEIRKNSEPGAQSAS